ncbi:MAG: hypothetical protein E3J87_10040 [Candidatus Cloacimonadota bacterium]|nr:MAG: hypothetical protein E3J87_10040 [Candidatus Cloacimonadota bacterium]
MRNRKILLIVLLVLAVSFLTYSTLIFAQDKEGEGKAAGTKMEKPVESLKYQNIMGDLGPDYHFLADIGEMIDKGREHNDGNTLIAASLLLLYAEKASEKESSIITGKALLEETAELAKEQKNAELAEKLADVYEDDKFGIGDKDAAKKFRKLAKQYKAASSARAGIGTVIINNDTPYYIRVYIDGYDRGIIYSGNVGWVNGVGSGTILLYGYAPYTDWEWGPITGHLDAGGTYTWNLIFN